MTRTGWHAYLLVGRELGGILGVHGDDDGAAAKARARRQEAVGAKKFLRRRKDLEQGR
jgi:hypothetical protein